MKRKDEIKEKKVYIVGSFRKNCVSGSVVSLRWRKNEVFSQRTDEKKKNGKKV